MAELIGPSPAAGRWKLASGLNSLFPNEEMVWEWGPREPVGKFCDFFNVKPLRWIFIGQKPEYNWIINRWAFISNNPGFHLVKDEKIIATRFFETDEGEFHIAENSKQSKEQFQTLKDTYDQTYYIELEKIERGDLNYQLEPPANIPWSDRLNSRDIEGDAWKKHDLEKEEGPEWNTRGNRPHPEFDYGSKDPNSAGSIDDLKIPLGASAMRDCGLKATLFGSEIDLMSYSEEYPIIQIGCETELHERDQIEIQMESENMKEELTFTLTGLIKTVEKEPEGRTIATISLNVDSHKKIHKIRAAIEQRQAEILQFFKFAKGVG
jgi:hypothetical protein